MTDARRGGPDEPVLPEVAAFLSYLRVEKGLSQNTLDAYGRDLTQWLAHVAPDGVSPQWRTIHTRQIRAFVRTHLRHKAPATQARFLSSLRRFFHFLRVQDQVSANPVDGITAPRQGQPLPKTMPAAQVVDWINALADSDETADRRDAAIFGTLYGCGLRVAELVAVDVQDDWSVLSVVGKGNKQRMVPMPTRTATLIRHWLVARQGWVKNMSEPALFVNTRGQRLTTRGVQDIMQRRIAALPQAANRPTPHVLRHSYATDLLMGGVDLRAIQELLGHAGLSTTQRYTHLDFAALARTYDQTHPRS